MDYYAEEDYLEGDYLEEDFTEEDRAIFSGYDSGHNNCEYATLVIKAKVPVSYLNNMFKMGYPPAP